MLLLRKKQFSTFSTQQNHIPMQLKFFLQKTGAWKLKEKAVCYLEKYRQESHTEFVGLYYLQALYLATTQLLCTIQVRMSDEGAHEMMNDCWDWSLLHDTFSSKHTSCQTICRAFPHYKCWSQKEEQPRGKMHASSNKFTGNETRRKISPVRITVMQDEKCSIIRHSRMSLVEKIQVVRIRMERLDCLEGQQGNGCSDARLALPSLPEWMTGSSPFPSSTNDKKMTFLDSSHQWRDISISSTLCTSSVNNDNKSKEGKSPKCHLLEMRIPLYNERNTHLESLGQDNSLQRVGTCQPLP
jgi:hypothetical protein